MNCYESLDIVAQASVFLESERAKHARKLHLSYQWLLSRPAGTRCPAMPSLDPAKWTDIFSVS